MISTKIKRTVPFGREYLKVHPNGDCKDIKKEVWIISTDNTENHCEFEVYANKSVVIWSEYSGNEETRFIKKSFKVDHDVIDLQWCSFKSLHDSTNIMEEPDKKNVNRCISVLESTCVEFFNEHGPMYAAPLPFKACMLWPLPNGLCVQRMKNQLEEMHERKEIPILFSLVHPLDDFSPIVFQYPESKKSFYFTDSDQEIIFTSSNLPVMVTYDKAVGTHTIWKVKKATAEDKPDPVNLHGSTYKLTQSFHTQLAQASSRIPSPLSATPSNHIGRLSYSPSPIMTRSRQQSPARTISPSNFAKMNSPALASRSLVHKTASTHSAIIHEASFSPDAVFSNVAPPRAFGRLSSPLVYRLSSEESASIAEDQEFDAMPPNVCLEYLWQEDEDPSRSKSDGKASNVFVIDDICEQSYICLMLSDVQKLRLIEFNTNTVTSSFSFGSCTDVTAKYAGPLESLKMHVILDPSGELLLYSGVFKICSLDSMSRIENLVLKDNSSSSLELLRASYSTSSQEMPRNRSPSFDDISSSGHIDVTGLRDFNKNSFSMVLHGQDMYKITVPDVTNNELVSECIAVVKENLDSDSAFSVMSKYYSFLNDSDLNGGNNKETEWRKFVEITLMLLGFPENLRKSLVQGHGSSPAPPEPKKAKKSESFCETEDWEFVTDCQMYPELNKLFNVNCKKGESSQDKIKNFSLNATMPLYKLIPKLFNGWHLLYEDLKLNVLSLAHRKNLSSFLSFLSKCLKIEGYHALYMQDFPDNRTIKSESYEVNQDQLEELQLDKARFLAPANIEKYLLEEIPLHNMSKGFPSSHKQTQLIVKTFQCIKSFATSGISASPDSMISELNISDPKRSSKQDCAEKLLEIFASAGFGKADFHHLPFGLALIYQEIFHNYRSRAPCGLPSTSALLLEREDLAAQGARSNPVPDKNRSLKSGEAEESEETTENEIFNFRFNCDLRIEEVKRLLNSSNPVNINIIQRPEVSDHDFIKEQETKLMILSKRTMALPVGRGMFTLGTCSPMIAETISIPVLEMNGKAIQSDKVITLSSQPDLPADLLHWPSFHNGVAAGLRIMPGNSEIDSTWIVYNKLKYKELNEELAGFIMALGLTGHLSVLPAHLIHDYLSKGHEFTSVALLLGMAVSKCGSEDSDTYKLLAVHVDALLPPTALEVSIPHAAQVAAILGIGLLHLETSERHLVKILLQEIGRPPGPEMENAFDRESHSLASGFALGMVMLGKGADSLYLRELKIAEELHHLMFGGQQHELPAYLKEVFKSPSYLIKEGDAVNTDVTCSSAIMALTLIYLKTNNRVVSDWLCCPETTAILDTIKPDNLLLIMLGQGLILWNETVPSIEWVESHLPKIFENVSFDTKANTENEGDDVTLRQCYFCILAGCCMALGIRFAGSANRAAFDTILHYTRQFKKLVSNPSFEKEGKAIGLMCLNVTLLSLSVVMAGTGNLEVLRIARSLHKKCSADVGYGAHMAVHMSIGFLFLGGGRYTLSTHNKAVAGLLCALYPKFPINSRDNRYHLQAFRHLYILACEPRLVIPRDIESGSICYVPLLVKLKNSPSYPSSALKLLAPCFVPEFSYISEIQVIGPRYWPITIKVTGNMNIENAIKMISCLYVKKKAGYLSYSEDPKGHKNLMARTFTGQSEKLDTVKAFSSSPEAILFAEMFCSDNENKQEIGSEFLSDILFECVANEKLEILQTYMAIQKAVNDAQNNCISTWDMFQLKMIFTFYDTLHPKLRELAVVGKPLINRIYMYQAELRFENTSSWEMLNKMLCTGVAS